MDHESRCLVPKKATNKCPNSKIERVPYVGSYSSNDKENVAIRSDRARNNDGARYRKLNETCAAYKVALDTCVPQT